MGYSINTCFKDAKQRDEVLTFLEKHYRPWEEVAGLAEPSYVRGPTDDPAYAPKNRPVIGFDYSGGAGDRNYAWQMCCWMARMTKRRYINYDGDENISLKEMKADEIGYCPVKKEYIFDFDYKRVGKLIQGELKRLTALWRTEHP